jgi:hypothetical protein
MRFYSKHDIWLGVILLGGIGIGMISTLVSSKISIWSLAIIIVFFLCCWVWFGTKYIIEEEYLVAKSGPFVYKIKISDITNINKTRNFISSPACSLDRIEVKSDNKFLIISPKDKTYFIDMLQEKNPSIKVNV